MAQANINKNTITDTNTECLCWPNRIYGDNQQQLHQATPSLGLTEFATIINQSINQYICIFCICIFCIWSVCICIFYLIWVCQYNRMQHQSSLSVFIFLYLHFLYFSESKSCVLESDWSLQVQKRRTINQVFRLLSHRNTCWICIWHVLSWSIFWICICISIFCISINQPFASPQPGTQPNTST